MAPFSRLLTGRSRPRSVRPRRPSGARNDALREIDAQVAEGARVIIVAGEAGAGQRELLAELAETDREGRDPRYCGVIDLTPSRSSDGDGVELLDEIAALLRRRNLGDLPTFTRRLAAYRSRRSGRPTTVERVADVVQTGLAVGGAAIPGAGPAVAGIAASPVSTGLRDVAVDRLQGSGELAEVQRAFVEDIRHSADPMVRMALVIDGVDERPEDPAVRVLVERILPSIVDRVSVVASAGDPDVNLGPALVRRHSIWLRRLTDATVRAELRRGLAGVDGAELDDRTLGELVRAVDGSPGRLANVVSYQRTTSHPPSSARYLSQARAWADSGQVYRALQELDDRHRNLAFCLGAVRWVNRPLLDAIATATSDVPDDDIVPGDLLRSEFRPAWLSVDQWGWRIHDDRLRRAMLEEHRRTHPDRLMAVHRAAAAYHRDVLWSTLASTAAGDDGDLTAVPQRDAYQQARTAVATAHEAEWLYHLLAIDPDTGLRSAVERTAEALQADDDRAMLELPAIGNELTLPRYHRYILRLLSEAASASVQKQNDRVARALDRVVELLPEGTPGRALLLCTLAAAQIAAKRHTAGVRTLRDGVEASRPFAERDARCRWAECLAGALLAEAAPATTRASEFDQALGLARTTGDIALLADVHRICVRASPHVGFDETVRRARAALSELDGAIAPELTAAISTQLAFALTHQQEPDRAAADWQLASALEVLHELGDPVREAEALAQRHVLSLLRKDEEAARTYRARAFQIDPTSQTHRRIAVYLSWTGDRPREVLELEAACALDARRHLATHGDDEAVHLGLVDTLLAAQAAALGDDDARATYLAAAEARWRDHLGEEDRTLLDAVREAELGHDPDPAGRRRVAHRVFAQVPVARGLLRELASAYERLATVHHREPDRWRDAWAGAATALRPALAQPHDEPDWVVSLIWALRFSGEPDEADRKAKDLVRQQRTRLERVGPDDAAVLTALGDALSACEDSDAALAHYERAYEIEPNTARAIRLLQTWWNSDDWTVERLEQMVAAHADTGDLVFRAARLLAKAARDRARAMRRHDARPDETSTAPSTVPADLPARMLATAVGWFRAAATRRPDARAILLEAAEMLLDVADVTPPGAPDVWDVLDEAMAAGGGERRRIVEALARLVRGGGPAAAADALATLRTDALRAVERTTPADVLEHAISPIAVEIGTALLPGVDPEQTPDASRLYDAGGMLTTLRAWIGSDSGITPPGVRVRVSETLDERGIELVLHDAPRARRRAASCAATTALPERVEAVTGRAPAPDGRARLPDGRPCVWLTDRERALLEQVGAETFDARALLCLALADTLTRHLGEVLDTQRLVSMLRDAGLDETWNAAALPTAAALLRRLVHDGASIADLAETLRHARPDAPFSQAYDSLRQQSPFDIARRLRARRHNAEIRELTDDDIEQLLDGVDRRLASHVARQVLPLAAVARLRRELATSDDVVAVAVSAEHRVAVAEALLAAGVELPVLSVDETGAAHQAPTTPHSEEPS